MPYHGDGVGEVRSEAKRYSQHLPVAGSRLDQPGEQTKERRLAAAVVAFHGDAFARKEGQRQAS
ncbi:MAG: hypothetical protein V3S75_04060 [Euzebya tangerina]|nr:hypothetical protein [Euzebya tangerina]